LAGAGHLRNAAADLAGEVVNLAARVAALEYDLAVETRAVTPSGWRRTQHGLDHIDTLSDVWFLGPGQYRWSVRKGISGHLKGGIAPTLAAGVRAVEEVLNA